MMYIVLESGQEIPWHVGEDVDLKTTLCKYELVNQTTEVQADGDERTYIEKRFTGLPNAPKNYVVRWYGDHAKFIVGNL